MTAFVGPLKPFDRRYTLVYTVQYLLQFNVMRNVQIANLIISFQ